MDIRGLGSSFSYISQYVVCIPMASAVPLESFDVSVVDIVCVTDFVNTEDFGTVNVASLQRVISLLLMGYELCESSKLSQRQETSINHAEFVGIHLLATSSTEMTVSTLTYQGTIKIIRTTVLPLRPFCGLKQHIIPNSGDVMACG